MTGLAGLYRSAAIGGAAAAVIRCAGPEDAAAIAALYHAVQIRPKSGRLALWDFNLRGGMFEVPSRLQIKRECTSPLCCFSVAEQSGRVVALMRLSEDLTEYGDLAERFPCALRYVELAVRSRLPHMVYPFLAAGFEAARQAGWKGLLFQIYHLSMLRVDGVRTPLNIDNRPGVGLNTKLGAVRVGELAERQILLDGCELSVRPDVYHLPLRTANIQLAGLCRQAGWSWTDETV